MPKKASREERSNRRRRYSAELREEAVRMMLDGQSAELVARNLGVRSANLVYRWRAKALKASAPAAALDQRVQELEEQLRRTERERDILKKALAIFSHVT